MFGKTWEFLQYFNSNFHLPIFLNQKDFTRCFEINQKNIKHGLNRVDWQWHFCKYKNKFVVNGWKKDLYYFIE